MGGLDNDGGESKGRGWDWIVREGVW